MIHAAAVARRRRRSSPSTRAHERVFAPKADAAWHLHELTKDMELSAFILFSSVAGTLGDPGQANYAAANVFLDALAAKAPGKGLPATSIAWGAWVQESGMTSSLREADLARMRRSGDRGADSTEQGLELFDAALRSREPLPWRLASTALRLRTLATAGRCRRSCAA